MKERRGRRKEEEGSSFGTRLVRGRSSSFVEERTLFIAYY